jgi:hypothetical protein
MEMEEEMEAWEMEMVEYHLNGMSTIKGQFFSPVW